MSGRHAEIEHRGGTWLLRDTSTNGTFVNDSDEALGPGAPAPACRTATASASASTRSRSRSPAATIFLPQELAPVTDADLDASFEVKNFISTGRRERERERTASRRRPRAERAPPRTVPPPAPASATAARAAVLARARGTGTVARPRRRSAAAPASIRSPAGRNARHGAAAGRPAAARDAGRIHRTRAHARGLRRRIQHLLRRAPARRDQCVRAHRRGRADPRDDARGPRARRHARRSTRSAASSRARASTRSRSRRRCARRWTQCSKSSNPEALEEQLGRRAQGVAAPSCRRGSGAATSSCSARPCSPATPACRRCSWSRSPAPTNRWPPAASRDPGDRDRGDRTFDLIGGEGGIRTHEYLVRYYWNSSPAPSTARPPLRRRGHSLLEPGSLRQPTRQVVQNPQFRMSWIASKVGVPSALGKSSQLIR